MDNSKEFIMTSEGYKQLEEELDFLKVVKRKEMSEKIKTARGFGDLSENSEYDEAMNEQAQVEARIAQIEASLKFAKILDEDDTSTDVVKVGVKVRVLDIEFDEEEEYTIVGSTESDPYKKKVSNESPIGKALLGKQPGDIVEVSAPVGIIKYKVLEITR